MQQVKSEWAETIESLKTEDLGHADALARARKSLAETAKLTEKSAGQKVAAAQAESEAADAVRGLERAKSENRPGMLETLKGENACPHSGPHAPGEQAEAFQARESPAGEGRSSGSRKAASAHPRTATGEGRSAKTIETMKGENAVALSRARQETC